VFHQAFRTVPTLSTISRTEILEAMAALAGDPFQGIRERRWVSADEGGVDLQERAARSALRAAGLEPRDVDFVLGSSLVPDQLNAPDVCATHERLRLRPDCFTMKGDAVCNSFQMQLRLAEGLFASGPMRRGLLLQCSVASRTVPMESPWSVHFGDGATAVVVEPCEGPEGLLHQGHRTDGSLHEAMVLTVNERRWWEDGRITATPLDRDAARRMFLSVADVGRELLEAVFERAGVGPDDIDFFAAHQPTQWCAASFRSTSA